jgi:acetyl-CoA decarbonylase/synthase, CODH/ACS complex subunit gamma
MAKKLTGMEIFKLLPKTNCGECGVPTCMAFAMKLAQKNAELSSCPYASDEAKTVIGAASEPPIRLVKFGSGNRAVEMGNELVMFRHEKTFVHRTALAVQINDSDSLETIEKASRMLDTHIVERAGEKLFVEALLINNAGSSADDFQKAARAAAKNFGGALILKSADPEALVSAADALAGRVPLLHAVTKATIDRLLPYAVAKKIPIVISAPSIDEAYVLIEAATAKGHRDIVIDISVPAIVAALQNNTMARKAALGATVKPLGYPLMNFIIGRSSDFETVADASTSMCKYASLLVLDRVKPEVLLPLLMLRQNIYTDPQKPIQVEPRIYPVGEPSPASPLLVTTNFSLT